jgi:23S rRNA (adenine-C8)-methyltransferase
MTDLPRPLRDRLVEEFGPSWISLAPLAIQRGAQVEKALFANPRGARIETVLSRYRSGLTSLCLSTQVGCGLGCTFCATGAVGLVRNLTADEICEQVLYFARHEPIDSVAFMGMGEALANPHTYDALDLLTSPDAFGLAPRRITVSTVGFAPGLRQLVERHPRVRVTLSVHSPYDEERAELIPLQRRFPLAECLDILDEHVSATRRKVYLAYLLIAGRNDSDAHAHALAELVRRRGEPRLFHVSVLPYNEAAGVAAEYRRPDPARVQGFLDLLRARGVKATRRQQFGAELDAACGQLHARYLTN